MNQAAFRSGFCWGLGIALGVGTIARQILYGRSRFLQFFKPTKIPATKDGPSPFQTMMGCLRPLIFIIMVVIILAVYAMWP